MILIHTALTIQLLNWLELLLCFSLLAKAKIHSSFIMTQLKSNSIFLQNLDSSSFHFTTLGPKYGKKKAVKPA